MSTPLMPCITPGKIRRLVAEHPSGLAAFHGDEPDDHVHLWAALERGQLGEVLCQYARVQFSIVIEGRRQRYRVVNATKASVR